MNIKYQAVLICVKNMQVSRAFYEQVLDQQVEHDYGENVAFHGGFAIHEAKHFSHLLFQRPNPHISDKLGQENIELYFELGELDEVFSKLKNSV